MVNCRGIMDWNCKNFGYIYIYVYICIRVIRVIRVIIGTCLDRATVRAKVVDTYSHMIIYIHT